MSSAERNPPIQSRLARRRRIQWALLGIVLVTIALGWRFPWLGFSVPLVMVTGIVGSLRNGRYVCGHLCPRGGFYDRVMAPLSLKRPLPKLFRSRVLRWSLVVVLMGVMVLRIAQNPSDLMHWGRVFWLMCLITTGIGVLLALLIHPRSWCSFCPMGTMQAAIGGRKRPLRIDRKLCRKCLLCERTCPMDLTIVAHLDEGIVSESDCLRCGECIGVCPVGALSFPPDDP